MYLQVYPLSYLILFYSSPELANSRHAESLENVILLRKSHPSQDQVAIAYSTCIETFRMFPDTILPLVRPGDGRRWR